MTDGRVALVTGATGGIGPAVAAEFAAEEARLALLARNPQKLEGMAEELKLPADRYMLRPVDFEDSSDVQDAVESAVSHFGRLDVVINLLGSWTRGRIADTSDETWHHMLAVNLHSIFYVLRAAVPHLPEGGAVVNVGNVEPVEGKGGQVAYAVAKEGVHVLTRSLALELRERGVRVNAVLPTNIDTPGNRRLRPNEDPSSWPSPEEVARAIAVLASPSASVITGALVPVGGRDSTM